MKNMVIVLVAVLALPGCAYFTKPVEHPIIEQHAQNRINTFAVIPSRRMMIVKSLENPDPAREKLIHICAEAPADVTDNLASSLAASLAVSGKAAEASAGVISTLGTVGQNLFKRTQGIQLFRDRSYHLCQARMNGFLNDTEYIAYIKETFDKVIPLIEKELALLPQSQPNIVSTPAPPVPAPKLDIGAGGARTTINSEGIKSGTAKPSPQ